MISKVGSSYAQAIAQYTRASQKIAPGVSPGQEIGKTEKTGFTSKLASAVKSVDTQQQSADSVLKELASGQNVDIHGTMIQLEKADITLRTMVSVRDKLVGAYEQIMSMAI